MPKERIHYLDVLKGALILYVIAYHSVGYHSMFFFLFHFVVVLVLERYTDGIIYACTPSLLLSLGLCVVLFLIVFGTTYIVSRIVNKYCPWIAGEGL